MTTHLTPVEEATARRFLESRRLAVVGASGAKSNFGGTIVRELRTRGHEVTAVNPNGEPIDEEPCVPDLMSVPGEIDGVIVMVSPTSALDVVRACVERGVARIWLFRGIGGSGSVSNEALDLCHEHGIEVIAGACPLMFLEPVGWAHRVHRSVRRRRGALVATERE